MSRLDESRTSTTRDDFETPEEILVRVREVFGGQIDLDPCGKEDRPTPVARASIYKAVDGLRAVWGFGARTAFLNPPYGQGLKPWVVKAVEESAHMDVITLTPARPDTAWYDWLARNAVYIAHIRHRIVFEIDGKPYLGKNGKPQTCQFPCVLSLLSRNTECATRFLDVMSRDRWARIEKVVK